MPFRRPATKRHVFQFALLRELPQTLLAPLQLQPGHVSSARATGCLSHTRHADRAIFIEGTISSISFVKDVMVSFLFVPGCQFPLATFSGFGRLNVALFPAFTRATNTTTKISRESRRAGLPCHTCVTRHLSSLSSPHLPSTF